MKKILFFFVLAISMVSCDNKSKIDRFADGDTTIVLTDSEWLHGAKVEINRLFMNQKIDTTENNQLLYLIEDSTIRQENIKRSWKKLFQETCFAYSPDTVRKRWKLSQKVISNLVCGEGAKPNWPKFADTYYDYCCDLYGKLYHSEKYENEPSNWQKGISIFQWAVDSLARAETPYVITLAKANWKEQVYDIVDYRITEKMVKIYRGDPLLNKWHWEGEYEKKLVREPIYGWRNVNHSGQMYVFLINDEFYDLTLHKVKVNI